MKTLPVPPRGQHKEPHGLTAKEAGMRARTRARRRGTLVLIGAFLILTAVLGWWQARARQQGRHSPVERLLLQLLLPPTRLAGGIRNQLSTDPTYPTDPVRTPLGMSRYHEMETEIQQLRATLRLRDSLPNAAIPADVIARGLSPWQCYLVLGQGRTDGVRPHQIALTPDGVLGQVITADADSAQVLLLTDRASSIGAMIERTRVTGVLKGDRLGRCQLCYLPGAADVQPGDDIVTSGLSEYYPKGLPLGKVTAVHDDPTLSSRTATVIPTANPATAEVVMLTH